MAERVVCRTCRAVVRVHSGQYHPAGYGKEADDEHDHCAQERDASADGPREQSEPHRGSGDRGTVPNQNAAMIMRWRLDWRWAAAVTSTKAHNQPQGSNPESADRRKRERSAREGEKR